MGSSLSVPEERWLALLKGSVSPEGLPTVDRLTNKSGSLLDCCSTNTNTVNPF